MIGSLAFVIVTAAAGTAAEAASTPAARIEVPSALITLIEQVDVPAREAGVLTDVKANEGQMVEQHELLAQIADVEVRLAEDRVKTELEIARRKAQNDVNVRFARKSVEVAKAELNRGLESLAKYAKSISDSEMDRLRLTLQRTVLEVEQAQHDLDVAGFTQRIKENELQVAQRKVQRRKVVAPLDGVVVQVNRRRGEWVEPGETVLRILRIDRLRAEGFLSVSAVRGDLRDRPVVLTVDLPGEPKAEFPGKVVFLSPEIDPVNAQIRVWAEVENRGLRLRPGMRAKMTIEAAPTGTTPGR